MTEIKLSLVQVGSRYGISESKAKRLMLGHYVMIPIAGYRKLRMSKLHSAVYNQDDCDAQFKKIGMEPIPLNAERLTITDIAAILDLPYKHAKALIENDERAPKPIGNATGKGGDKLIYYSRKEFDAFQPIIEAELDKNHSKPKIKQKTVYEKRFARKSTGLYQISSFNAMAVAFISQPSEIRPRREACANAVTKTVKVRYQDWV